MREGLRVLDIQFSRICLLLPLPGQSWTNLKWGARSDVTGVLWIMSLDSAGSSKGNSVVMQFEIRLLSTAKTSGFTGISSAKSDSIYVSVVFLGRIKRENPLLRLGDDEN
jgi:hypothetical protein